MNKDQILIQAVTTIGMIMVAQAGLTDLRATIKPEDAEEIASALLAQIKGFGQILSFLSDEVMKLQPTDS